MSNTSDGALFKNERRNSDKHPHATGQLTVMCPHCEVATEYWLSAWTNEAKSGARAGQKYQSIKINPKDAQQGRAGSGGTNTGGGKPQSNDSFDDDIPF